MAKEAVLPQDVRMALQRLQDATRNMPALESEMGFLEVRLTQSDMSAAHLGIRTCAEALLRHAAHAEQLPADGGGPAMLQTLEQSLRPKVKGRVSDTFWIHLQTVRTFGNSHAHYQWNDVYLAPGLRPADPWSNIALCIGHLANMVAEFAKHWPPPAGISVAPVAGTEEEEPPPSPKPGPSAVAPPRPAVPHDLVGVSVTEARDRPDIREALKAATGMTARGISRRLNSVHGRTKLRNLFPESLAQGSLFADDDSSNEAALDYEAIGNLTIAEARELDVAAAIARLTNDSLVHVNRELRTLNGHGVVRRRFSWYEAATIKELTVRTAIDYRMTRLLARELHRSADAVARTLGEAAGQTKLRSLFPDL